MTRKILALIPLLLLALPATARDVAPSGNNVKAVTVYPNRAQVTRQLKVDLPAGSHTVLVADLPGALLEHSLQVRGQSSGRLLIGAIEARRVFSTQLAAEREQNLADTLRALRDERAALDGRRQALDTQAAFIERLAQLPTAPAKEQGNTLPPEKWPAAWQAIGNGMTETNRARTTLQQELRTLDEKIKKAEQELEHIRGGRKDSVTAALQVETTQAGSATFELTYQVPGATWEPVYDARLASEQRTLQLTQAAWVQQNSGEDWTGVALTLSTAQPATGAAMPELSPWWIDFLRPMPVLQRSKRAVESIDMPVTAMAPLMEAEERATDSAISEFSASYHVPGTVTLLADNTRQRFVLDKQEFAVKLAARSTPRLDPRAFVYTEFTYTGATPLLPGTWRLTRDDADIGELAQEVLRPGEQLALAFGSDDAVEVKYHVEKDQRSAQGVFSKEQQVERRYRVEISNRHGITLPVTIYDQLPVARDEQIQVTLDADGTPPSAHDVDERAGVLAWHYDLKPQGKQVINFGYRVNYPQDRQVPGF